MASSLTSTKNINTVDLKTEHIDLNSDLLYLEINAQGEKAVQKISKFDLFGQFSKDLIGSERSEKTDKNEIFQLLTDTYSFSENDTTNVSSNMTKIANQFFKIDPVTKLNNWKSKNSNNNTQKIITANSNTTASPAISKTVTSHSSTFKENPDPLTKKLSRLNENTIFTFPDAETIKNQINLNEKYASPWDSFDKDSFYIEGEKEHLLKKDEIKNIIINLKIETIEHLKKIISLIGLKKLSISELNNIVNLYFKNLGISGNLLIQSQKNIINCLFCAGRDRHLITRLESWVKEENIGKSSKTTQRQHPNFSFDNFLKTYSKSHQQEPTSTNPVNSTSNASIDPLNPKTVFRFPNTEKIIACFENKKFKNEQLNKESITNNIKGNLCHSLGDSELRRNEIEWSCKNRLTSVLSYLPDEKIDPIIQELSHFLIEITQKK